MISYKRGDVTKATERIIVHGCNCQGTWGSGVAKAMREKFREAYLADLDMTLIRTPLERLGSFSVYHYPDKTIYNAYTQLEYGKDGKRYMSYDALVDSMTAIFSNLAPRDRVAMPRIGAGLGGGDWDIIWAIINRIAMEYNVEVVVYIPEEKE